MEAFSIIRIIERSRKEEVTVIKVRVVVTASLILSLCKIEITIIEKIVMTKDTKGIRKIKSF